MPARKRQSVPAHYAAVDSRTNMSYGPRMHVRTGANMLLSAMRQERVIEWQETALFFQDSSL
jgi:hypothetical protein